METALISYLLQAFDEMCSGNPVGKSVDFDSLVHVVEGKMRDPDLLALRHFGARVDSVVASILAPLAETGEVVWEPESRRITVSDFGFLLLHSEEPLEIASLAAQADQARFVLR